MLTVPILSVLNYTHGLLRIAVSNACGPMWGISRHSPCQRGAVQNPPRRKPFCGAAFSIFQPEKSPRKVLTAELLRSAKNKRFGLVFSYSKDKLHDAQTIILLQPQLLVAKKIKKEEPMLKQGKLGRWSGLFLVLVFMLLAGCARAPSSAEMASWDYGPYLDNYKQIIKKCDDYTAF